MRGQFVFRPPAPIGDPIKDQQKKIQDLEDSIEIYNNLLNKPNVPNHGKLEELLEEAQDQVEQARQELRRLAGGSDVEDTSAVTPGQGKKRVLPPRGRTKITPLRFDEESEQGGNAPPEEILPSEEERSLPKEPSLQSPKRSRPPKPQLPQVPEKRIHLSKETEMLNQWTRELNSIVSRALAPLMRTLGIVAARLRYDDVRPLLRWKQDAPLVEDRLNLIESAESVEEFVSKNSIVVGTQLLRLYIASYKPPKEEKQDEFAQSNAMIGAQSCFDLDLDDPAAVSNWAYTDRRQAALSYLNMSQTEVQFAPAWAFEVMGSGIFRTVLSVSCLGAFEAAHSQVNRIQNCATFTMKELICSPSVSDQFAFLVSSVYLLSGDQLRSVQGGGGGNYSRNSTYLNLARMRDQMGLAVYTCKIWFESVFAVPNPMLRVFQEKKRERLLKFQEELTVERFIDYMVGEVKNATPANVKRIVDNLVFLRLELFWDDGGLNTELLRFQATMRDAVTTDAVKKAAQKLLADLYRTQLSEIFNGADARIEYTRTSMTLANFEERYESLSQKMANKGMDTRELEEAFPRNLNQIASLATVGRFANVYKRNLEQFYQQQLNDWFQRSKQEASVAFEEKLNLYGNMLPKRELIYRG